MIDDPLKQQIKEANDIVDVVGSFIALRPTGPTFKAKCPFHDDHRPSMDVDPRRQRYRCWACGKSGDVINFVQEHEHVTFLEALEFLARRAGISLEKNQKTSPGPSRAGMLDVTRWAAEQFQQCLLDSTSAENARKYLGERKLSGETVRKFSLGFAPPIGEWLVQKAVTAKMPLDMLETVGLIGRRSAGGWYDRFRDRVIFPIRDVLGRIVGFGGRILPSSVLSADRPPPKYYNSAETPIFSKSDQLYGIDHAKQAAAKTGYLAIVEGYTDVLMAHQHGLSQVVATMGTALNARHIKKLKGIVSRVVLVFDADTGGDAGVDRAMEVFVRHDLDLRIATLPSGLDPCDLLAAQGPEPMRQALEQAVDVFEYKLQRVWARHAGSGLDGQRQAAEEMLKTLALTPSDRSVKLDLMMNRIAHRLQIKEETVWTRLRELRAVRKKADEREETRGAETKPSVPEQSRSAPAALHEKELLELLLAEPSFVPKAFGEVQPEEIEHPGLRKIAEALYSLHAEGQPADLDHLRGRMDNERNERIWDRVHQFQDRGLDYPDRPEMFRKVLERFRERRKQQQKQAIMNRMQDATDPVTALELLRQLKDQK